MSTILKSKTQTEVTVSGVKVTPLNSNTKLSLDQIWREIRSRLKLGQVHFIEVCQLVQLSYVQCLREGMKAGEWAKRASQEVGYSESYLYSLMMVADNKAIRSTEYSLLSLIDRAALIFLAGHKCQTKPKVWKAVLRRAIQGKYTTSNEVRMMFYGMNVAPYKYNRVCVYKAENSQGKLVYTGYSNQELDQALRNINVLMNKAEYKKARKRRPTKALKR